jgi:hypothetical protein
MTTMTGNILAELSREKEIHTAGSEVPAGYELGDLMTLKGTTERAPSGKSRRRRNSNSSKRGVEQHKNASAANQHE